MPSKELYEFGLIDFNSIEVLPSFIELSPGEIKTNWAVRVQCITGIKRNSAYHLTDIKVKFAFEDEKYAKTEVRIPLIDNKNAMLERNAGDEFYVLKSGNEQSMFSSVSDFLTSIDIKSVEESKQKSSVNNY